MSTLSRNDRFEALFREHYPAVLRFALRRASPAVAEDVAAETFAAAWRSFESIPAHAIPWLLAVAARRLASHYRAAGSQRDKVTNCERLAPAAARDHADAVGERDAIVEAFASLSERDREALRLVAWDGLSTADAARVLGITTLAFRARASRARRRLAHALDAPQPANTWRSVHEP